VQADRYLPQTTLLDGLVDPAQRQQQVHGKVIAR
jgi:hypothetical protein